MNSGLGKVLRYHALARLRDDALEPTGLNATQYAVLVNIERYQPVPQMTLAEHLELERTTLSP